MYLFVHMYFNTAYSSTLVCIFNGKWTLEKIIVTIQNGHSRDTGNIWNKDKSNEIHITENYKMSNTYT